MSFHFHSPIAAKIKWIVYSGGRRNFPGWLVQRRVYSVSLCPWINDNSDKIPFLIDGSQ